MNVIVHVRVDAISMCVRACVRACVCACVRELVRVSDCKCMYEKVKTCQSLTETIGNVTKASVNNLQNEQMTSD